MSKNNSTTQTGTIGSVRTVSDDKGIKFLALSLAVNEGFRKEDGSFGRKKTQWFDVVTFSRTKAELVNNSVSKGDLVKITGELRSSPRKIGDVTVNQVQIVLGEIECIATKNNSEEQAA